MGEIIIGLMAIVIGIMFCVQGNTLMRIMFPFMGFFAGFSATAGAIAGINGDKFLGTVFSWVVGFFVGLIFGVLAFIFYEFAIVLAFAGWGFAITSGVLTFLNLDWNWLVIIIGTLVGIIFGIAAIVMQLPMLVLIMITAFLGSAVIIYGLMLVFKTASLGDFSNGLVREKIHNNLGLYLVWFTFGLLGSVFQSRAFGAEQKMVKDYWESSATFNDLMKS